MMPRLVCVWLLAWVLINLVRSKVQRGGDIWIAYGDLRLRIVGSRGSAVWHGWEGTTGP